MGQLAFVFSCKSGLRRSQGGKEESKRSQKAVMVPGWYMVAARLSPSANKLGSLFLACKNLAPEPFLAICCAHASMQIQHLEKESKGSLQSQRCFSRTPNDLGAYGIAPLQVYAKYNPIYCLRSHMES